MPRRTTSGRMPRCAAWGPALLAFLLLALPGATATAAPPEPGDHGENDAGGFLNILPPGQGQTVNAVEAAQFLGSGQRPPHDQDQLDMYADLVNAAPGLDQATLREHFKDASFAFARRTASGPIARATM